MSTIKKISIDPITRLEGHGKIEIFLDDDGNVKDTFFLVPELRGFEQFAVGRPIEEMSRITSRICGVCPEAHIMAAAKASDNLYNIEIPYTAKLLRELVYNSFFVSDHSTHFYALGGPDFILPSETDKSERNIIGVIKKVGLETGRKVMNLRKYGHRVSEIILGRNIHGVGVLPGGMSKSITKAEHNELKNIGKYFMDFALFTIKFFDEVVLKENNFIEFILNDIYSHKTHNMGIVDDNNSVNFYDGDIRIVDVEGDELVKFKPENYLLHIEEHVENYTYLKFPYLKTKGWSGLVDGNKSGVYKATPLSRLNVSDKLSTPLAQIEFEKFYNTLGKLPVNNTLATHWARIIELLHAAEKFNLILSNENILSDNIRNMPVSTPSEGIGAVEAPRGTLIHHYKTDANGIVTKANLIVGTTNNHAAICMSIKKTAVALIKNGKVISDELLNMIEMAFRAYDPCFSCATHSLPGQMPLQVIIYDSKNNIIETVKRN